jgi:hypothetical protein
VSTEPLPQYVRDLIDLYGPPTARKLGTAVFYEKVTPETNLEQVALRHYREFKGDSWERFGADFWLKPWQLLYQRPRDRQPDIMSELQAMIDASYFADGYIDGLEIDPINDETAQNCLTAAYNAPEVTDLRIYALGDDDIIEGRLILGYRANGETTSLIVMMD